MEPSHHPSPQGELVANISVAAGIILERAGLLSINRAATSNRSAVAGLRFLSVLKAATKRELELVPKV